MHYKHPGTRGTESARTRHISVIPARGDPSVHSPLWVFFSCVNVGSLKGVWLYCLYCKTPMALYQPYSSAKYEKNKVRMQNRPKADGHTLGAPTASSSVSCHLLPNYMSKMCLVPVLLMVRWQII